MRSSSATTIPSMSASCTECSTSASSSGHRALRTLGRRPVVDHRGVGQQVDDAAEVALLADRELERRDTRTEAVLQLLERAVERRPLAVELVDEDDAGDAALPRPSSTRPRSAPRRLRPPTRRTPRGRPRAVRPRRHRRSPRSPGCRRGSPCARRPRTGRARATRRSGAAPPRDRSRTRCCRPRPAPSRAVAPEAKSSASASVVLPAPPWPTRATLRILAVGNVFTRDPPLVSARSWRPCEPR